MTEYFQASENIKERIIKASEGVANDRNNRLEKTLLVTSGTGIAAGLFVATVSVSTIIPTLIVASAAGVGLYGALRSLVKGK